MADPTTRFVSKANAIAIVQGLKSVYTNQDAIAKVKVGSTIFTADEAQDQIELLAGTNVQISSSEGVITFSATDTTYTAATQSADGLMSSTDKTKLDGIAAGAEVNQNSFSNITVGSSTLAADAKTDTFELAGGTNVTLGVNGDVITISAADTTYTLVQDANDGHKFTFTPSNGQPVEITIPDSDTTYDPAVASVSGVGGSDGLITAADKEKLDGIAAGAQVNVLEGVKVNGTSLTATNKAVDVTIASGTANGTIAVNGSDVSVTGLGAAAYVGTESTLANDSNLPTGAAVTAAIEAQIAAVYKPAGSVAFANLPTLAEGVLGNVYNVTDAFTSTADFVEGAGNSYPAGTNVVVVETETDVFKFDVLPGFVDLSPYQTIADLGGLTASEVAEIIAEA